MNVQIIQVPYDSGHEGARTGKGPDHLIRNGLDRMLQESGHNVDVLRVESGLRFSTEIGTTFEVNRLLAKRVGSATHNKRFPLVLAGNCNSCVGTLAGIGSERLGIIWFDAHGDFNTPETTTTGFLDGMGLAMAAGRCWEALLKTIPGFQPVPVNCIVHVGARDLDADEKAMLEATGIPLVRPDKINTADFPGALEVVLLALKNRVDGVYLHVDMDVLATEKGKPNHLAVPGGLPCHVVEEAVRSIRAHFEIKGAAIASYDPDCDENKSVLNDGFRIIKALLAD